MRFRVVESLVAGALTVACPWFAGSSLQAQERAVDRRRSLDPNMPVSDDPRRVPVAPGPTGPEGTIVLVGGRVFDGTGTPARPATIVIERNRIAAHLRLFGERVRYIDDYTRIVRTATSRADAMAKMTARYPGYGEANFFLKYSVENHVKP